MDKGKFPTKLLWIDLEMTGLNPSTDLILEVAAVVTDFDFTEHASYESIVLQDKTEISKLIELNEWWRQFPESRDTLIENNNSGKLPADVQNDLIELVKRNFSDDPVILAGNSIHQDRKFIENWWPELNKKLHYRMFDVTALKIYMIGKYRVEYQKKSVHRAVDDIQESMAEWKYYLDWLKDHNG